MILAIQQNLSHILAITKSKGQGGNFSLGFSCPEENEKAGDEVKGIKKIGTVKVNYL